MLGSRACTAANREEQSRDPEEKGAAVPIDLDLNEQIDCIVSVQRELGVAVNLPAPD